MTGVALPSRTGNPPFARCCAARATASASGILRPTCVFRLCRSSVYSRPGTPRSTSSRRWPPRLVYPQHIWNAGCRTSAGAGRRGVSWIHRLGDCPMRGNRTSGTCRSNAKLTEELVLEARTLRKTAGLTYEELASRYSVSKSTMIRAVRGDTWTVPPRTSTAIPTTIGIVTSPLLPVASLRERLRARRAATAMVAD